MGLPEDVGTVGSKTLVEWILWLGRCEWWVLSHHDEEDDGGGEEVDRLALIWHLEMDLWRHVVEGTELGGQVALTISSLNWCSETEVCYLEGVLVVEEKILWLEISVSNSSLVTEVETLHKLVEEVSGEWLAEPSRNGDEVEEFTTEGDLKDDVGDGLLLTAVLDVFARTVLELSDDVLVLEVLHGLDLSHDELSHLLVHVVVHYLDGNFAARDGVRSELDLA